MREYIKSDHYHYNPLASRIWLKKCFLTFFAGIRDWTYLKSIRLESNTKTDPNALNTPHSTASFYQNYQIPLKHKPQTTTSNTNNNYFKPT